MNVGTEILELDGARLDAFLAPIFDEAGLRDEYIGSLEAAIRD